MKRYLLISLFLIPSFSFAQEDSTRHEAGLLFRNVDSFGLTYRIGKEKALWRFSTLFLNGFNNESETEILINESNGFSIGTELGREYRKYLAEKLQFRYGGNLIFQYSKSENSTDDLLSQDDINRLEQDRFTYGFSLIIGFNYLINENFLIGIEVLPSLQYSISESDRIFVDNGIDTTERVETDSFSYGFNSNFAQISLVYAF